MLQTKLYQLELRAAKMWPSHRHERGNLESREEELSWRGPHNITPFKIHGGVCGF